MPDQSARSLAREYSRKSNFLVDGSFGAPDRASVRTVIDTRTQLLRHLSLSPHVPPRKLTHPNKCHLQYQHQVILNLPMSE